MNRNGEIIIIEDDEDDHFLLEEVFTILNYPNKRVYFHDGFSALEHLHDPSTVPFLVLSDINMPQIDGFELREKLKNDADIHLKCIPYLFFSTAMSQQMVIDAYSMSVQGFFIKPGSIPELTDTIKAIIEYWKKCASPTNFQ
ncbi:response regulator [Dyadobacter sp. CY107]|uniref:response regulator n=1 Tax=Dyadobacter fanqingshengii TaxID=2906443 RepID=UPI001F3662BC|nr:response regulator [Dyadobacter fanqingshengii]MCF2505174.1 response regulator [Dyadobacter fanqingshengii]